MSMNHTIDGSVTINGLRIDVHTPDDAFVLKRMLDAFLVAISSDTPTSRVTDKALIANLNRTSRTYSNAGNTTRDRIIEVFTNVAGPKYSSDIVKMMEGYGWESNAQDKKRYVEVVMYRDKQTFKHLKGGKWALLHPSQPPLQPSASETVADIQTNANRLTLGKSLDRFEEDNPPLPSAEDIMRRAQEMKPAFK